MSAQHGHPHADTPGVHHEDSDVNIRAILVFLGVLLGVAIVVHIVIWLLFLFLAGQETKADVRQYPMAIGRSQVPPAPRLQTAPRDELRQLREEEAARLEGYGWVDKNAGVVRIPIDEAMKLTLERGLPARPAERAASGASSGGSADAGSGKQTSDAGK